MVVGGVCKIFIGGVDFYWFSSITYQRRGGTPNEIRKICVYCPLFRRDVCIQFSARIRQTGIREERAGDLPDLPRHVRVSQAERSRRMLQAERLQGPRGV